MAPTRSTDTPTKKRRGRPPGSRKSDTTVKPVAKRSATTKTSRKKPSSREEGEDELSTPNGNHSQSSRVRKRRAHDVAETNVQTQAKPHKKLAQLETRTKRISQSQIDTWPQVSIQVLEQIVSVIRDAKKDIANTQRDERKVIAAHNALNPLVKKLAQQLSASRIPPQAKDIHFNIDRLTERNAQVSREVTKARHAKQLLSEQIKVADNLLKKDEENLEQLKTYSKKWKTEWKHQEKHGRLHPLLQNAKSNEDLEDGPDDINLKHSEPIDLSLLEEPDSELVPVLEQLRRSLENMQGNHTQVEGIDVAMLDAQVALDEVVFRHANAQQYAAL